MCPPSYELDASSASLEALDEELLEPLLPDASASASSAWRETTPAGKQSLQYEMVLLYVFRVLVFNCRIRFDGTGFASRMDSGAGGALLFLANTMFFCRHPMRRPPSR